MNKKEFGNQRSAESNWAFGSEISFMLDLMQVAVYASICKQVVYRVSYECMYSTGSGTYANVTINSLFCLRGLQALKLISQIL
jgi:hypothetical protein